MYDVTVFKIQIVTLNQASLLETDHEFVCRTGGT